MTRQFSTISVLGNLEDQRQGSDIQLTGITGELLSPLHLDYEDQCIGHDQEQH